MWDNYYIVETTQEAVNLLSKLAPHARIVAGGTDLLLELERGVRKDAHSLIDISRIKDSAGITLDDDNWIHLGPLVTHNQCVASPIIRERAFPLARAAWEVGSPQIRNRGTIAGNLITASPANDTITPLMAMGALVTLKSKHGERKVALKDFYTGVRRTVMAADEMLVDIAFPAFAANQSGVFIKFALRRAQAISVVNVAVLLSIDEQNRVTEAAITYGAVAPTIIHATEAEAYLKGKKLDDDVIRQAASIAANDTRPISDVRSSAGYRRAMARVICESALRSVANNTQRSGFPRGSSITGRISIRIDPSGTRINPFSGWIRPHRSKGEW